MAELDVAARVARVLDSLGLRYLVGGSLASSLHGLPRSSHDADILAELPSARIDDFVRLLESEFYVDGAMIRHASHHGISFNLIHYDSGYKVDVFLLTDEPLLQEEMRRRQLQDVGDPGGPLYFATAEDMVLQKLAWYRAGGQTSERQWTDVLGILKVQKDALELEYVTRWAERLGIGDLVSRALSEAAD